MLPNKYYPKKIEDLLIEESIINQIKELIDKKTIDKPILIHGNSGIGKSILCEFLLKEYDILEISSHTYKEDLAKLSQIGTRNFFGKYIIVFIDDFSNFFLTVQLYIIRELKKRKIRNIIIINSNIKPVKNIIKEVHFIKLELNEKKVLEFIKLICYENKYKIYKTTLNFICSFINNDIRQLYHYLEHIFFTYKNIKKILLKNIKSNILLFSKDIILNTDEDSIKFIRQILYDYDNITNIYDLNYNQIKNSIINIFLKEIIYNRNGFINKKIQVLRNIYKYINYYNKILRYKKNIFENNNDVDFILKVVNIGINLKKLKLKKNAIYQNKKSKYINYYNDLENDDEIYLLKIS